MMMSWQRQLHRKGRALRQAPVVEPSQAPPERRLQAGLRPRERQESLPGLLQMYRREGEDLSPIRGRASYTTPVSYTHLDVYKRQDHGQPSAGTWADKRYILCLLYTSRCV